MLQPLGYFLFAFLLLLAALMPHVPSKYWVFRIFDFGRIQLVVLQLIVVAIGFFLSNFPSNAIFIMQLLLLVAIVENIYFLAPFVPFKKKEPQQQPKGTEAITILSANVFQENKQYHKFFEFINKLQPDIFFTMESNAAWEKALSTYDADYPFHKKVAMENTYGMHFYSKLEMKECIVNYFMAEDVPSLEITLVNKDGQLFTLFGLHPPPPSPTEEPNSKERDGELVTIGKEAKKCDHPVIVLGDFNNVAWSKSAILFKKISGLTDPRIGRGFIPTYHARYWLFRFPIDLFYHSQSVVIQEFKALGQFGSDHLPLYCKFYLNPRSTQNEQDAKPLDKEEEKEAQEMISEGKEEDGARD